MSNVSKRVNQYVSGIEDEEPNIQQTVTITLRGRAQLEALVQVAGRSKTRIASQLLMDALDDAIEAMSALPDPPLVYGTFYDSKDGVAEAYSPRGYVHAYLQDVDIHNELSKGRSERLYTPEEADKRLGKQVEDGD